MRMKRERERAAEKAPLDTRDEAFQLRWGNVDVTFSKKAPQTPFITSFRSVFLKAAHRRGGGDTRVRRVCQQTNGHASPPGDESTPISGLPEAEAMTYLSAAGRDAARLFY